jgi:C1A family cysteine protease
MLPLSVDLRSQCPAVYDQGQEGSCSGHASAGAVDFLELRELAAGGPQVFDPGRFENCSRNFIYYGERMIEGTTDSDAGATTLRDACAILLNVGVCREALWPYGADTLLMKPSEEAYAEAIKHKLTAFYGLEFGYQLKHCLAAGFPFMLGFRVRSSLMSEEVADTGNYNPAPNDSVEGGHAVLCVGYDDTKSQYLIRNSWGDKWGMGGYFTMPYNVMEFDADDYYTLRREATVNP